MSEPFWHYYHVYADGNWRQPLLEHFAALTERPEHTVVGIVGTPAGRRDVRRILEELADEFVTAETGWEQVTLDRLRSDLDRHDRPVLYAHTKGAANATEVSTPWRQRMTRLLVAEANVCLDLLPGADVVGCHWLTPQDWPDRIAGPFFGGNFWWAQPDYLRTLDPLNPYVRHDAEHWIGSKLPRVVDRAPGWPGA